MTTSATFPGTARRLYSFTHRGGVTVIIRFDIELAYRLRSALGWAALA